MKLKRRNIDTAAEVAVGVVLLCAVGWFLAKTVQASSAQAALVNQQGLTQPNTTQLDGQNYYWPGPYSGSTPSLADSGATTAGLTPITIPNLPVSAPYFGPSNNTPASTAAGVGCSCATGYVGSGANFDDQSALAYTGNSFGSTFIGGSTFANLGVAGSGSAGGGKTQVTDNLARNLSAAQNLVPRVNPDGFNWGTP